MQKVPGVVKVEVSLNQGLTKLDLQPGNTVTLAALRQVIRNNGFPTPEASVIAIGTVTAAEGRLTLEVTESKERFPLAASPARPGPLDELRRLVASGLPQRVEITGTAQLKGAEATLAVASFRVM
jgi:hypothetical protein